MSRARRANESSSVFPFLAVLVCVMGALIFMLLLISTRIRSEVVARAIEEQQTVAVEQSPSTSGAPETEPIPEPPAIVEETPVSGPAPRQPEPAVAAPDPPSLPPIEPPDPDETIREEIAELTRRRAERAAAIAQRARAAEVVEKKQVTTRNAIAKISEQLKELNARGEQKLEEKTRLNDEKQRLTAELVALESDVRKARQTKATESSKFTYVAYDGASGTTRRPILIECTSRGIHFIPENVFLTPGDVAGFTERQNPLLAGADALAKFWWVHDRTQNPNGATTEPYVLLIVRPSGTVAYYYARRFLSTMTHPFGYELLEDGRELELPPVNPQAQAVCRQAVDAALAQRRENPSGSDDLEEDEKPVRGSGIAGRPGARMTDEESPGVARRGSGGSSSDGGRSLRYRPGVGFEVVEEAADPTADDPFEQAARARRKTSGSVRSGGSKSRGASAPGGVVASDPTGRSQSAGATGTSSPAPRGIAASGSPGTMPGAGGGGPAFGNPGASGTTGLSGNGISGLGQPAGVPGSGPSIPGGVAGTTSGGAGIVPNARVTGPGPVSRGVPAPFQDDGFSPLTIPTGPGGNAGPVARESAVGTDSPVARGTGDPFPDGGVTTERSTDTMSEGVTDGVPAGEGARAVPGLVPGTVGRAGPLGRGSAGVGSSNSVEGGQGFGESNALESPEGAPGSTPTGRSTGSTDAGTRRGGVSGNDGGGGGTGGSASGVSSGTGSGSGGERGVPGGVPGLTPRIDLDPDGDHTAPQPRGTAPGPFGGTPRAKGGARGDAGHSRESTLGRPETGEEFDAMPMIGGRSGGGRPPGERRWGYYSRRASIGFERAITVRVHADRIRVGRSSEVLVEEGESADDLTDRLMQAVDEEAKSWGRPPDSFYWCPSLKMVVSPGGNQLVERLASPLKHAGLPSKVEYSFEGKDSSEPARLPPALIR